MLPVVATLEVLPPDHNVRRHHRYGMSKLNAFAACPGYEPKDTTNAAAEDGTRLHEVMDMLTTVVINQYGSGPHMVEALDIYVQGAAIDPAEYSWLRFCCEGVDFWLARGQCTIHHEGVDFWLARGQCTIHHEIKVSLYKLDGTELNHGHLDLLLIYKNGSSVLIDYKFGWLPVPKANENLQGKGYALGAFNEFEELDQIGVVFLQPKLRKTTTCTYQRADFLTHLAQIEKVIDRAEQVRKVELSSIVFQVNPNCDYCGRAGNCPALLKVGEQALQKFDAVPLPLSLISDRLETPEEIARALYMLGRLEVLIEASKADENGIKGVRRRALELAKAQPGGKLEVEIAPGRVVVLTAGQRKAPRSAQHPALIAEALQDVLTPTQVLACCDVSVTKLEDTFAEAYVAKCDAKADARIAAAEEALAKEGPREWDRRAENPQKVFLARVKAEAKEMRSTKKAAKELLTSVLTAEQLMSRADGLVDFLKVRLETTTHQLGDSHAPKQLTYDTTATLRKKAPPNTAGHSVDENAAERLAHDLGVGGPTIPVEATVTVMGPPQTGSTGGGAVVVSHNASGGFQGEIDSRDFRVPQFKIVNGSGPLSREFNQGAVLYAGELLWKAPEKGVPSPTLKFVPFEMRKQWREKLTQEEVTQEVMPRTVDTAAEAHRLGGGTEYGPDGEPPRWQASARCHLLLQEPEGGTSTHSGFCLTLDGKNYAPCVYYCAGTAYREFFIPLNSRLSLMSVGMENTVWQFGVIKKPSGNFQVFVPVVTMLKEKPGPEALALIAKLKGVRVNVEAEAA